MHFFLLTFLLCLEKFRCEVLIDYRFSSNYGQVFYDYSGNKRHAVNGESFSNSDHDVIATDRGIYFKNSNDRIRLPANDYVTSNFVWPSTFTLAIWAMTISDTKQNILYRESSSFSLLISIKDEEDKHRLRLKYNLLSSDIIIISSDPDAMKKNIWHFISLTLTSSEIKLYCDGLISLYETMSAAFIESQVFETYLGKKEDEYYSFSGFIHSFLLFDTLVNIHLFYSDTGITCYLGTCPSSCSPAIIISNSAYCMPTITDYSKSANGHSCSDCSDGSCTIGGICLKTESCSFPSMTFSVSSKSCMCSDELCTCSSGQDTFNGNVCAQKTCNSDCLALSCMNNLICTQCASTYASPSSPSGCVCNKGYFQAGSLSVQGGCSPCSLGCDACTASACTKCAAYDAIPDGAGCKCKDGTYQISPLSETNACRPCNNWCKTCNDLSSCIECTSSNASPSGANCICNTGYISNSLPTKSNSCVQCAGDCLTCASTSTCFTCIIPNSVPSLTSFQRCNCITGHYYDSGSCEQCHIECYSCDQASVCLQCKDSNAQLSSIGCVCKAKYYTTHADLSLSNSCIPCNAECGTCNNLNQCTSCVATNASPAGSTCACNLGFQNFIALSNPNACIKINPDCNTINADSSCLSCVADFAFPYLTLGCKCGDGYYNITSLHTSTACIMCNSECLTCSSTACLTCKNQMIQPAANGRCACNPGYYQDPITFLCVKCNPICKTCSSASVCLTCFITSSNLDVFGKCSCPNHSTTTPTACICNDGYYMTHPYNYFCEPCNPKCLTCSSAMACTSCANSNLTLSNDQCVCKENMYWDGYLCQTCSWLCANCTDFDKCVSCADSSFEKNETDNCNKKCESTTFPYLGGCSDCGKLCKSCRSSVQCDECVENAGNSAGMCSCNMGYEGTASCDRVYFAGALSVDSNNLLTLAFEEDLDRDLLENEFLLSIKDIHFNYSMAHINSKAYRFSIVAEKIPKNSEVNVTILRNSVTSINNSLLKNSIFIAVLNEYGIVPIVSAAVKAMMNSTKAIASSMVSSSIASSIVSNPSCMWILLNTLDLISFLPLGSVPFSENLVKFFTSLGGINILPNPSNYIINVDNKTAPYSQAKRFGLETSYIFINAGPYIWNFLLFVSCVPLLLLGSRVSMGKLSEKCLKILLNYKYGFFVRFWMQAYLPMGILALVQLNSVMNIKDYSLNSEGKFNVALSIFVATLTFITPLALLALGFYKRQSINNTESRFFKKWGGLYQEFKNNKGFMSSQYYFTFTFRRLIFMISQVFLNFNLQFQATVIGLSSLMQLLFMLIYLPFHERLILISSLIGELCVFEVCILSLFFVNSSDMELLGKVETTIVLSILVTMATQTLVGFVAMGYKLKEIYNKIQIYRSKRTPSKIKITPTNEMEVTNANIEFNIIKDS